MLALLDPTHLVQSSGYLAIFILCVLQSCCVPTSSELTLGFAGYLAASGQLSLPKVILVGAAGELVGAYAAWVIGRVGARAFVDHYGRWILLSHHDLDRAEAWYGRHSRWGVLVSRLVPVIRNFVALPAGAAEVPLLRFGVLTAIGSLIWDAAWAVVGYELAGEWRRIVHGFSYAGYILAALAVLALVVLLLHRYRSYRRATGGAEAAPARSYQPAHRRGPRLSTDLDEAAGVPAGDPSSGQVSHRQPLSARRPAAAPRSSRRDLGGARRPR